MPLSRAEHVELFALASESCEREVRNAQGRMYRGLDLERYRAYARSSYRINSVRIIEYQHRHYRANWDYIAARQKLYRQAHLEETRTAQRNWREANAVAVAASRAKYDAEHREQIAAYRATTREHRLQLRRENYLANRDRVAIQQAAQYQRRKARALKTQNPTTNEREVQ